EAAAEIRKLQHVAAKKELEGEPARALRLVAMGAIVGTGDKTNMVPREAVAKEGVSERVLGEFAKVRLSINEARRALGRAPAARRAEEMSNILNPRLELARKLENESPGEATDLRLLTIAAASVTVPDKPD